MDWNKIANNDNLLTKDERKELKIIKERKRLFSGNMDMTLCLKNSSAYTLCNMETVTKYLSKFYKEPIKKEDYANKLIKLINNNCLYSYIIFLENNEYHIFVYNELIYKTEHINYLFNFPKNLEVKNLIIITLSKKFEGKFLHELISNKKYHNIIIDKFNELNKEYKINLR